jgi:hypothetical protein
MGIIIAVAVILVVAVAVALLWQRQRGQDPELAAARRAVRERQAALKAAERTRDAAIREATNPVAGARKARDKRVGALQSEIRTLSDPKGRRLGAYHGVTLHELWLSTPHGSGSLAGVNASVDAQISSRITATRLVAIGVFALAANKKTGAVYLSIDGPEFASVVECPQTENTKAREFAVKINNASRAAAAAAAARPRQLESAWKQLRQAERTDEVDAAQRRVDEVSADETLLAPIRAAESQLQQARVALTALQPSAG